MVNRLDQMEQRLFDSLGKQSFDDSPDFRYFANDIYGVSVLSEEILFQGKLHKYHAGFKNDFQPKWIVVTKSALRYYKNQESAVGNPIKPLISIPICAIESIAKVSFDLKLTDKQKIKFKDCLQNQLQIVLKEDFLDYYLRLDYEELMRKVCKQHAKMNDGPSMLKLQRSLTSSPSKKRVNPLRSSDLTRDKLD